LYPFVSGFSAAGLQQTATSRRSPQTLDGQYLTLAAAADYRPGAAETVDFWQVAREVSLEASVARRPPQVGLRAEVCATEAAVVHALQGQIRTAEWVRCPAFQSIPPAATSRLFGISSPALPLARRLRMVRRWSV
jgi:hypothetical protein